LLFDVEKWLFTQNIFLAIFTLNGITYFIFNFLFMLSIASLWIGLKLEKRYKDETLKNFTLFFTIATILPQPIIILWNLLHIPRKAINLINVLIIYFIFISLCYIVFKTIKAKEKGELRHLFYAFFGIFFVLVLFSINISILKINAKKGEVLNLKGMVKKLPEKVKAPSFKVSLGEEVFERVCSVCHNFERKKIGPPLKEVILKYKSKDELKNFIKNPVRVNLEFPAMPPPSISDEEAEEVVNYIMERAKK